MISRMDRYVGNVLNLLDELKLADNTIVVFSSDNGTTHLKAEVDYDFFASVGELRGLKGSLYEGGVRVPTIVRWPDRVQAGSESDRISGWEDWMPTLLAAAGFRLVVGLIGFLPRLTFIAQESDGAGFVVESNAANGGYSTEHKASMGSCLSAAGAGAVG